MNRNRSLATAFLLAAVTVTTSGCGGQGVAIPEGWEDLSPCPSQLIDVEALSSLAAGDCDFVGSTLQLPGGVTMAVPPVGNVFTQQGSESDGHDYHVVNWGVPGVAASSSQDGTLNEIWAVSAEAGDLQRQQAKVDGLDAR